MKLRARWTRSPALVAVIVVAVLLTAASAAAKKKPPPPPGGGVPSTTSTFVKNYANVVDGTAYDLTPEDVEATSDGGSIALAITRAVSGVGVGWLAKANAVGAPQWQEEIGCFDTPPGDYSDALSVQPTGDGGYVLAGGTLGCGSGSVCPATSGIQCGLVEKVDGTGRVVWARAYSAAA